MTWSRGYPAWLATVLRISVIVDTSTQDQRAPVNTKKSKKYWKKVKKNMSLCCFRPLPWKRAVIPGWKTRKICCLKGSSNLWAACLRENRQTVKIPVLVSAQKSAATAGHWCLAYTWLRPELLPATPLKRNENKLVSSCLQWCLWVCFVLQARIVRPDCRCFQGQCKYYSS